MRYKQLSKKINNNEKKSGVEKRAYVSGHLIASHVVAGLDWQVTQVECQIVGYPLW